MNKFSTLAAVLLLCSLAAEAQTGTAPRRALRAFGEATVSIRPDQARITLSVVTRGTTAQEASEQNVTRSNAVFAAVKALIGNAGEIETTYYNVSPYSEGNPPRQAGFQVTNTVRVTVNNFDLTGRVIDAAVQAGATRVDGLVLGLRDDEPVQLQALRAAGQRARARAESIAAGLNVRLGQVVYAEEGFSYRPLSVVADNRTTALSAPTIEPGTLDVRGYITVEYEILQ
jgi:uncharacterized protein YggE